MHLAQDLWFESIPFSIGHIGIYIQECPLAPQIFHGDGEALFAQPELNGFIENLANQFTLFFYVSPVKWLYFSEAEPVDRVNHQIVIVEVMAKPFISVSSLNEAAFVGTNGAFQSGIKNMLDPIFFFGSCEYRIGFKGGFQVSDFVKQIVKAIFFHVIPGK